MSDLRRSFAKSQFARLPTEPAPIFDERDEIEHDIQNIPVSDPNDSSSSASSASSTGTIVPSVSRNLFERPKGNTARSKTGPLEWNDFFTQELFFDRNADQITERYHAYITLPSAGGPLFVTHHGAGSSGLSFAVFAAEIQKLIPESGVLSLDARGHGLTTVQGLSQSPNEEAPLDLTLPTLASDLAFVVHATTRHFSWTQPPPIILLGHSLGGAVVVEVAHKRLLGSSLLGYGVLDVVEGSAMDALQSMESYLAMRPASFPSLASGIEWHTRSRTIRNTTSARVSVPALLREIEPTPSQTNPNVNTTADLLPSSTSTPTPTSTAASRRYTWITSLSATKPFWEGWFRSLSSKFLGSPGGKLLLLAGTDRLDKELMIGQMQGKYQLQVFPEAGHFVHEDQPAKTAAVVADFYRRNDRGALVLPPKVGDLIKQGKFKG